MRRQISSRYRGNRQQCKGNDGLNTRHVIEPAFTVCQNSRHQKRCLLLSQPPRHAAATHRYRVVFMPCCYQTRPARRQTVAGKPHPSVRRVAAASAAVIRRREKEDAAAPPASMYRAKAVHGCQPPHTPDVAALLLRRAGGAGARPCYAGYTFVYAAAAALAGGAWIRLFLRAVQWRSKKAVIVRRAQSRMRGERHTVFASKSSEELKRCSSAQRRRRCKTACGARHAAEAQQHCHAAQPIFTVIYEMSSTPPAMFAHARSPRAAFARPFVAVPDIFTSPSAAGSPRHNIMPRRPLAPSVSS